MRAERKIFIFDGVFAKMVKYICDRSVSIAEKKRSVVDMVRFIVDSTFGLTLDEAENLGVRVVNLTLLLDGKEYPEGYCGQWNEFYDAYAKSKSGAKTSQPSPKMFMNAMDSVYAEDDGSDIVIMTIGNRLSGTVSSASVAKMQYPDRNIAVIDSHNAAGSALLLLRSAGEFAQSGASFSEVTEYIEDLKKRTFILFIPARLTELARGGRVSKLVSTIGNILNIKPVFRFGQNEVSIPIKTLGLKLAVGKAVGLLPDECESIAACYIAEDSRLPIITDKLREKYGLTDIDILPVSPVLGAHIGLGAIGVAIIAKKQGE